jgi:hypothetical protein
VKPATRSVSNNPSLKWCSRHDTPTETGTATDTDTTEANPNYRRTEVVGVAVALAVISLVSASCGHPEKITFPGS